MRLQNLIIVCLLLLCLLCILCCRKARTTRARHERKKEYVQSKAKIETVKSSRKHGIINKKSSKKLDGREVFEKYSTAVFMVFTSDGMNGYQGSGFFIDNQGLAVSNYHVFKGTGIGMEKIKLLGSDVIHNVTKIVAKDEEEDYILFRVDCDNTNYLPIASSKPKST